MDYFPFKIRINLYKCMLSQDFYMFLDLYFCFVHYPVYINSFSKNCFYGLYQLRTEVPPNIQRSIWELILIYLPSTKMLVQYLVEVLSTALNSLVVGIISKIWSTKGAKKRHLCASISANSLHGVLIFVILQVTPPIGGGRNYFFVLFSFVIYVRYVAVNVFYDSSLKVVFIVSCLRINFSIVLCC